MSTNPVAAPAAPKKNKFLGFVESAGEKIVHVVEDIGEVASDVVKIVETGKEITPAVKASLSVVFEDGQAVATAVLAASATGGGNWASDAAAVASIEKFVKDFIAQIPIFKNAVQAIEADVN